MVFLLRTTSPFRFLLTSVAILALNLGHLSYAGVGESRDKLVSEGGRYGNPSGETSATLEGSRERVDVFKKDNITVSAEYDAEDKVWKISYHKKNLADAFMTALLEKNGGDRKWSKPVSYRGNKHWISSDKQLHAVYYSTPLYKLVIMTDDAARAVRLPQTLEGRETKRIAEDDTRADGDQSEKKADDPLKGFWSE